MQPPLKTSLGTRSALASPGAPGAQAGGRAPVGRCLDARTLECRCHSWGGATRTPKPSSAAPLAGSGAPGRAACVSVGTLTVRLNPPSNAHSSAPRRRGAEARSSQRHRSTEAQRRAERHRHDASAPRDAALCGLTRQGVAATRRLGPARDVQGAQEARPRGAAAAAGISLSVSVSASASASASASVSVSVSQLFCLFLRRRRSGCCGSCTSPASTCR